MRTPPVCHVLSKSYMETVCRNVICKVSARWDMTLYDLSPQRNPTHLRVLQKEQLKTGLSRLLLSDDCWGIIFFITLRERLLTEGPLKRVFLLQWQRKKQAVSWVWW